MHGQDVDVTIHMMVKNEWPTVVFSLLSVLPIAKEAIVVDTGSTDGTWEWLQRIKRMYPEKIRLSQRNDIPDSTNWEFFKYCRPNQKLGALRGWMIEETKTKYIWVVDGDEVYRDITVQQVADTFENWPDEKRVVYVPLLWFAQDVNTLGCFSPGTYPITGRLFLREGLEIHGAFPGEMHLYNGEDLGPRSPLAEQAGWMEPFHHFECVCKPWRRKVLDVAPYNGPQPEVFKRYGRASSMPEKVKGESLNGAQNFSRNSDARPSENRIISEVGG
jgi:glycosyltransferase involved in cell wall biosynthesis